MLTESVIIFLPDRLTFITNEKNVAKIRRGDVNARTRT